MELGRPGIWSGPADCRGDLSGPHRLSAAVRHAWSGPPQPGRAHTLLRDSAPRCGRPARRFVPPTPWCDLARTSRAVIARCRDSEFTPSCDAGCLRGSPRYRFALRRSHCPVQRAASRFCRSTPSGIPPRSRSGSPPPLPRPSLLSAACTTALPTARGRCTPVALPALRAVRGMRPCFTAVGEVHRPLARHHRHRRHRPRLAGRRCPWPPQERRRVNDVVSVALGCSAGSVRRFVEGGCRDRPGPTAERPRSSTLYP